MILHTPAATRHEAKRWRRELDGQLAAIPTDELRDLITRSLQDRRLPAAQMLISEFDRRARVHGGPVEGGIW